MEVKYTKKIAYKLCKRYKNENNLHNFNKILENKLHKWYKENVNNFHTEIKGNRKKGVLKYESSNSIRTK